MEKTKVLLVDDETGFRDALARRLSHRGLEVCRAGDGQEALNLLAEFKAEVVVLDVKMPGMNGMEALQRIKAADPTVEVILLTGHADMESSLECLECGAFDYMLKPADIEALYFKIVDAQKYRSLRLPRVAAGADGPAE